MKNIYKQKKQNSQKWKEKATGIGPPNIGGIQKYYWRTFFLIPSGLVKKGEVKEFSPGGEGKNV